MTLKIPIGFIKHCKKMVRLGRIKGFNDGIYTYEFVISKRPDLKEGIDIYLTNKGNSNLIVGD